MIVQCEACQTRFRLADEKVKPGGTKVRCSKCKEIFTVIPPAHEPEPVEESVDFDSFNMEDVSEESPETDDAPAKDSQEDETSPAPVPEPEDPEISSDNVDFSGLEAEMGSEKNNGEELAEDFSFADTSEPAEEQTEAESTSDFQDGEFGADTKDGQDQPDFEAAFAETDESAPSESMEFDFDDGTETENAETGSLELDSSNEDEQGPSEFSFDDESEAPATAAPGEEEVPGEFSFDEDDNAAFSFDEEDDASAATGSGDEFSFDEESPFEDEPAPDWGEGAAQDGDSFDFEEPQFDADPEPAKKSSGDEGGLQFGEIDFATEDDDSPPGAIDEDFTNATMETQSEQESFTQQEHAPPSPPRNDDDQKPLPAPPPPKKSSLSRIVVLLVLLLVILGGAAAFLFMQGSVNLNMITEYLPFLKEYIGETQQLSPADSIDIEISDSSYVNNAQTGQMLVIQGRATNKHPGSRSSITIKGVLLDAKGRSLLQQTVFCGNPLSADDLESLSFKQIEEAMNNEFGAGLSNMNISSGTSIPFTIVFRNLPDGIANINVEVVDSKPGAN